MAMTLITTNTFSDASSSTFTSSIDSTYKLFLFKILNVHIDTDATDFRIQFNVSGQTGYDETMTTTWFDTRSDEAGSSPSLQYFGDLDKAQATTKQSLSYYNGNGADESVSGTVWLFNPSNTTYVTQWYARTSQYRADDLISDTFVEGYVNATGAVVNVEFSPASGNFDGTIKMYGV